MSDKETKGIERKPLSRTSQIAMRYLNERFQREMQELLEADAATQGIGEGWQYDLKGQSWVREA